MSAYQRLRNREEGSGRPGRTSRATGPTGLVFFPAFDWAISPTHPEREERLLYTRDQVLRKVS